MILKKTLTQFEFQLFQELISRETGLFFSLEKKSTLEYILYALMREKNIDSFLEYFELLKRYPKNQEEFEKLIINLTIGETYFFRNKAHFSVLSQKIIPQYLLNKKKDLTIWSAGCATGEEPYSIAMTLLESIPNLKEWHIEFLASDINPDYLKIAQSGIYHKHAIHQTPSAYLNKYFIKNKGTYELIPLVKNMPKFFQHNLIKDHYSFKNIAGFDIIFCRNVLIYFDLEHIKTVIEKFDRALKRDGYLFLGHSETLWNISHQLNLIEFPQTYLYQKSKVAQPQHLKPTFEIPEINLKSSYPPKSSTQAVPKETFLDEKEMFGKAYQLANEEKYGQAIVYLQKIILKDNLFLEAYYLLGVLYEKLGDFPAALREFKHVKYIDPSLTLAYYNSANIYLYQKEYKKAEKEWMRTIHILKTQPKDELVKWTDHITTELLLLSSQKSLANLKESQKS